jgi:hypothetical protein
MTITREDIAAKAFAAVVVAEAARRQYISEDEGDDGMREWSDEAEALRTVALEWLNALRQIDNGVAPVVAALGRS